MRIEKIESTAKFVKGALVMHDLKAEYVGTNIIHTGFHVQVAKGTLIFSLTSSAIRSASFIGVPFARREEEED
jgi:hypothetical protein